MRKLAVFLIVFAVGLALVLWLRGSRPEPAQKPTPTGAVQERPGGFTEIPVPGEKPDEPSRPLGISLDGRLDLVQRSGEGGTLKPLYELHARDVDLVGEDVYELTDLTIDVRNLETGARRAHMAAAKGRMRLVIVDGTPKIAPDEHATFDDVDLTLHEGAPIVPLTLEVPRLDWEIATNRFRSDDRVQLRGRGLTAEGVGLDADPIAERVHLARDGVIRLDIEEGVQAVLSATGAGQIAVEKATVEGTPVVHLRAYDGANLIQTGARSVGIDARTMSLHGRDVGEGKFALVAADASGDVAITSQGDVFRAANASFEFGPDGRVDTARLDGSVVMESQGDVFRADEADFRFDARGGLVRADLTGSPSGIVRVGRFLDPEVARARNVPESTTAEISGTGPLVLEFTHRTTLDLGGPGQLRVRAFDFTLDAQRSLHASLERDRQRGELVADGAVNAQYKGSQLSSDKLTMTYSAAVEGEEVVEAVTEGPTTLRGSIPDDARPLVLEAQQGLSVRSQGDRLTVPIARVARITVEDPGGLVASAALVRDFDWRARTFVAEGDVSYTGANGEGRAQRVVSHGPDDLELFGEPGTPARYAFREAGETTIETSTEATEIRARKESLDAKGEARASVAAADRKYELQGAKLHLDLPAVPAGETRRPFHAEAEEGVRTTILLAGGDGRLSCDKLFVDGVLQRPDAAAADRVPVTKSDLRAVGNVRLEYRALGAATGECDVFTLDREGRGRLSADTGKRVRAESRIPGAVAPYVMTAEWIEFDQEHVEAAGVDVKLKGEGLTPEQKRALDASAPLLELSTDLFRADKTQVLLRGKAHAKGRSARGEDWWIDAGSLRLEGRWLEGTSTPDALDGAHAWDGFEAGLGSRVRAFGERLDGSPEKVRMEGTPARLSMETMEWESAWIEYERTNMLLSTDRGYLHPREGQKAGWSVTYESMQPFDRDDSTTILVLRNPLFRQGEDEMRADWALFWVDREEWLKSGKSAVKETTGETDLRVRTPGEAPAQTPPPKKSKKPDLLGVLTDHPYARLLNEVYVEGNIEYLTRNQRTARARSIYLDIVERHGWIQDADLLTDVKIRGRKQRLRTKADWLRVSGDYSLRADNAVVTSCGYDDPHYVIKTGQLEVKQTEEGGYSISATKNSLAFGDTVAIPMPPLVAATDEDFVPLIDKIAAGNFAKFGASVQASFNFTLGSVGKGIGGVFGKIFNFPSADIDGHWKFRPGYLGSRGVILGTGLELEANDKFEMNIEIDGIPDDEEDKGLVRVPTDDRDTLRTWLRARGRYYESRKEWIDIVLSKQSDPGVQAEFFESDYLEYEQKDTYLHWRKANDQYYFSATAKVLLEDRTDIAELPSLGAYRGLTPIGKVFDQPILYRAYADVAYLQRKDGDPDYYPPFPDGLGDREVLRGDTEHRLEAPIPLGFAGLRATPFVSGRATAWNEGEDPETSPTRLGLFAGMDLATTVWKRYGRSVVHSVTPFVGFRTDIATEETDGVPVSFDRVEEPIEGEFFDLGLRTRLWKPRTQQHLDIELRTTHAESAPGLEDGFQPIAALAEFLTYAGDVPVGMTHDGRYDTEDGDTEYSRTFLGFEPHPKLGIEFGYHRGLDDLDERLYEAASIGARFRATSKWEFELEQTYSIADSDGLSNEFLVRRLGHDFIFEIEVGYRAGEGSSFGFSVIPDLSFRRSSLGLIDRWLGVYR